MSVNRYLICCVNTEDGVLKVTVQYINNPSDPNVAHWYEAPLAHVEIPYTEALPPVVMFNDDEVAY